MKILYVEDEPILRDEIAFVFEMEGYEVQTAEDGQMGWDVLQTYQPDIVVTDIKMPRLSGIGLLEKIRESQFSQLPVIVMSGFASSDWVEQAQALDIFAYISKPFSLDDVLSQLGAAVASL